ncbi:MAG: AtpZ/AtpI family protein [Gemmatimonadaceae bacterium]
MVENPRPSGPPEPPPPVAPPPVPIGGRTGSLGVAGRYAGLGLQFALAILLFLFLGQWLDRKLGTGGLFVILGVFVGAGAAFYSMYRRLIGDLKRDEADAAARKRAATDRPGTDG